MTFTLRSAGPIARDAVRSSALRAVSAHRSTSSRLTPVRARECARPLRARAVAAEAYSLLCARDTMISGPPALGHLPGGQTAPATTARTPAKQITVGHRTCLTNSSTSAALQSVRNRLGSTIITPDPERRDLPGQRLGPAFRGRTTTRSTPTRPETPSSRPGCSSARSSRRPGYAYAGNAARTKRGRTEQVQIHQTRAAALSLTLLDRSHHGPARVVDENVKLDRSASRAARTRFAPAHAVSRESKSRFQERRSRVIFLMADQVGPRCPAGVPPPPHDRPRRAPTLRQCYRPKPAGRTGDDPGLCRHGGKAMALSARERKREPATYADPLVGLKGSV